jgi:hypothetical protein
MARERASRERMRATVERWQRSGMSAASFSRREGIQARRLSYWKRVLGAAAPRRRVVGRPRLTPVQVVDLGLAGAASIEVVLAGGERLVVREGVSPDLLRGVLDVLRERC